FFGASENFFRGSRNEIAARFAKWSACTIVFAVADQPLHASGSRRGTARRKGRQREPRVGRARPRRCPCRSGDPLRMRAGGKQDATEVGSDRSALDDVVHETAGL